MFTANVPEFRIDLSLPAESRWNEVVDTMRVPALKLLSQVGQELRYVPSFARGFFAWLYRRSGGLYVQEIRGLARHLGVTHGTATVLNCAYELSHIHFPGLFGCTAGVRQTADRGMVHVRTLDWPLPAMGPATCLFRFTQPDRDREFVTVGVPGQVGVLSGMVPGGYSVTINWAPPVCNPGFSSFGPAFLLRLVLEQFDTYEQAVEVLRVTPLSTSVFFTVCGANPGQGCVIERGRHMSAVRPLEQGVVVQANHHNADCFNKNNPRIGQLENADFLTVSEVREHTLLRELQRYVPGTDLDALLDLPPVMNTETVQKMVFCPASGEVKVWRRV